MMIILYTVYRDSHFSSFPPLWQVRREIHYTFVQNIKPFTSRRNLGVSWGLNLVCQLKPSVCEQSLSAKEKSLKTSEFPHHTSITFKLEVSFFWNSNSSLKSAKVLPNFQFLIIFFITLTCLEYFVYTLKFYFSS